MNEGARHAGRTTLMFLHADTRLPSGAPTAVDRALLDPRVAGGRFDVALDNPRPIFGLIARLIN